MSPWVQMILGGMLGALCITFVITASEGKNKQTKRVKMIIGIALTVLCVGGMLQGLVHLMGQQDRQTQNDATKLRTRYLHAQIVAQQRYGSMAMTLTELASVDKKLGTWLLRCSHKDQWSSAELQADRFNHTVTLFEDCYDHYGPQTIVAHAIKKH